MLYDDVIDPSQINLAIRFDESGLAESIWRVNLAIHSQDLMNLFYVRLMYTSMTDKLERLESMCYSNV